MNGSGQPQNNLVPHKFLRKNMLVFDAVYVPEITPLLRAAAQKGCRTITGLEFFNRQAGLQSKIFVESAA